ncbi:MAG: ERAP1-like C-terminal domain-containing protein, partial [Candidatus Dormibacteraeota bacterium]|nr:ERAP1-like C-terminal domain-containing protein [Candidatus Dormibacteraeota bacterium]
APTAAERERFAKVLLHEMAHMWFGNLVTMRWWDDLWLNEAFAEFACNWAAEAATSYTDAWASHLVTGKLMAYLADQGPTSHPIRQPTHNVAEAMSIFDDITYPKGASVLKQLMAYLGEGNFTSGMAAYFARHAWGNTTLQDLIDALASASGRNLDEWRAGWLETAGTDRLTLEQGGSGFVLAARGPAGRPRPQVLAVGAYRRREGLERTALVEVEIGGSATPLDLPAGADVYLVNDDDLTFAITRPADGTKETLLAAAAELPTAVSRGVALATVWDMLVTGEATAAEAVRCLTTVLAAETSDSVIEPYLGRATAAAEQWAPDAEQPALTAEVAAACLKLAQDASRRKVALRAFAHTAGDLDQVAWLQAQASDDLDLQWRVLGRKAELGSDTGAEVEALLKRDPDPEAWVRALTVRSAAPDAAEKRAAWQALALDRNVPIGLVQDVATAFWRPGQGDLLAPYAESYLDLVPDLERGGMIPAMIFTELLFPLFGIDQAFLP